MFSKDDFDLTTLNVSSIIDDKNIVKDAKLIQFVKHKILVFW